MTRNEKELLRKTIYVVAHHNENLWHDLKHQIYDYGFQVNYPLQYDFEPVALRILESWSQEKQQALISEWKRTRPERAELPDSAIIRIYAAMIVEEVVRRASIASRNL